MNCKEVKANLSPYVAGDIERHGAREAVGAHLRECAPCRAVAEEWEASQRLLQLHRPPEFDDAFFDTIRRGVLRQISEPRPSLLARLIGQPFGQRAMTYAAVFSLLVCAAILSAHLLRRTPSPVVEVAKDKNGGRGNAEDRSTQDGGRETQPGGAANVNESGVAAPPSPRPKPSPKRGGGEARAGARASDPERKFVSPRRQPAEEQVARAPKVQSAVSHGVGPKAAGVGSPNHVETAAADREMLRIELQTSDPNVRIIWLSPATAGSASSNKPNR